MGKKAINHFPGYFLKLWRLLNEKEGRELTRKEVSELINYNNSNISLTLSYFIRMLESSQNLIEKLARDDAKFRELKSRMIENGEWYERT